MVFYFLVRHFQMKRCPQCGEHSVQRENHYTEWLEVCTSCGASQVLEEEAFKTGGGGTPRRTPQNEATGRGRPSWTGGGGGGAATSSRRGINYYPKVSACRRELRRVLNTSLSKVSKKGSAKWFSFWKYPLFSSSELVPLANLSTLDQPNLLKLSSQTGNSRSIFS